MVELIDGKAIAERIKTEIAKEIYKLQWSRPNLAIVLVGSRSDSQLYVSLKTKEGVKVGVDTCLYKIEEDAEEDQILETIGWLNKDEAIDGILVQLPLPDKFNTDKIIKSIRCDKDVDGFHPDHPSYLVSPVLASIKACLEDIKFEAKGKTACVLYNSDIFGHSVEKLLKETGLKILSQKESAKADLLITALGKPRSIKKEMIKKGAVIIDVGITKIDTEVLGDVDFDDVKEKASYITPVPGGIGPMTIAFLFNNVLEIYRRKN